MRCETHLGLHRSALRNALRRRLIGAYYRRLDGALAIGSANHAFYREMGVPEERIFRVPYTVDNARFTAASRLSHAERRELRAGFGVRDDRPIVLYAAKFQRRKHPDDLLRAAGVLNREGVSFHVVMIGSGEMETELRVLAGDLGLSNVHFTGFVNQEAMPRVYAACDIFVLPSENEPWGLAVNEAMCAGLPIVASSEIGCFPDLVHDRRNGRAFPARDVAALADVLRALLAHPGLRQQMGEASQEIISHCSYAECHAGLRAALASVGLTAPTEQRACLASVR
jgi:glycosyltransferase involved in cell wall biosynthesis